MTSRKWHPHHTPEVARPVVEAAAAVLGTPIAIVLDDPHNNTAEVHAIRLCAAVALVECGWSRNATAVATRVHGSTLTDKRWPKMVQRAKVGMPKMYAAALRVAVLLPRRGDDADARADVRSVIAAECRRCGVDPDDFHARMLKPAIKARRATIDELARRGWSTVQIARLCGLSESTVQYWRLHRTSTRPSRQSRPPT